MQFIDDHVDIVRGFAIKVDLIEAEGDLVTKYAVIVVGVDRALQVLDQRLLLLLSD